MTRTHTRQDGLVDLLAMLGYRRPHGSRTEAKFINRFIRPLKPEIDACGNLLVRVGPKPTILFSAHTDTVHRHPGTQKIHMSPSGVVQALASDCLGADDGAGCWLLREMILARVSGLYIFHRGEERGCIGSHHIARHAPETLGGIKAAIAFDRRGCTSVITHQMGQRSCSDAFGTSLAEALGLGHKLDPTGAFTDTASYTEIIPECTNVSVGYSGEHSGGETLDAVYLDELRDAVLKADWSKLVIERDPKAKPVYRHSLGYGWGLEDELYFPPTVDELVEDYPAEVASLLKEYGVTAEALADYLGHHTIGRRWRR